MTPVKLNDNMIVLDIKIKSIWNLFSVEQFLNWNGMTGDKILKIQSNMFHHWNYWIVFQWLNLLGSTSNI